MCDSLSFAGSLHDILPMILPSMPNPRDHLISIINTKISCPPADSYDTKFWSLTANEDFSVKSFCYFLNDNGLHYSSTLITMGDSCLKKINIFN